MSESKKSARTTSSQPTSSVAGSLASPYLLQASNSPSGMIGGSGLSSPESFANYDPDTCSWRTCQGCLLEGWATYSETWPPSGTMRNGKVYQRPALVPRTSVTGSSLLPTATATANQLCPSMQKKWASHRRILWPTPRQFMHKDSTTDRGKSNLGEVVGGQLNPMWVEWLQGFPLGWTEVD